MKIRTRCSRIANAFGYKITDYNKKSVLVECVQTDAKNDNAIKLFKESFPNRIEVVRGGSVAVEAISCRTDSMTRKDCPNDIVEKIVCKKIMKGSVK